uniref:Extracellular metalloproteinase n=1 Tax=Mycena chlorophos TaxID=658473 RepID=A0ABQ0LZL0_MYCCL|nr:elastinolytic metalloproteinase Mep [Mycena chlorophos]
MRVFAASLAVAGLASYASGHRVSDPSVRQRKSLGFGPVLKHAVYRASPYQVATHNFKRMAEDTDPFLVAQSFIEDILGNRNDASSYRIRRDSYTDPNTGITHVYVRQLINGFEVADGDMNINVKDGMILSYGNSFYPGSAPGQLTETPLGDDLVHPHQEFCDGLTEEMELRYDAFLQNQGEQVVMGDDSPAPVPDHALRQLTHVHHSNCRHQQLPLTMAAQAPNTLDLDLRSALLQFMVAATPSDHVANDILGNYDAHLSNMVEYVENHFAPSEESTHILVHNVPDTVNPVKATLAYVQVPTKDDSVRLNLVWKFEVEMQDNWYEAAVSAFPPHRIVSVVDWASDAAVPVPVPTPEKTASYNVFAWGVNDPSEGERSIEKENFDALASPIGWHSLPYANDPSLKGTKLATKEVLRNTTTTWGNNVFAQENWEGQNAYVENYRPDAGAGKSFDYAYSPKVTDKADALEEAQKFINATVAQLFYTNNMIHDLYYRYGFDEISGNFQQYNFGRGGAGNDAVIANAQDGSGYNNANFMTPPDGQNGRMRMYLWNTALPYRDGDFEAGIVIHEYSHGLSTRLTGGPLNSGCLPFGESGGMGEGWGDFLATTIRSNENYSDYAMGSWAANRVQGIRNYPYSLNDTINPSTYKTLDKPGYFGVHAIGEVWAEILWHVSQGLIAKHGFSASLYPPQPLEDGTVPEGDFYRPRSGKKALVPKHGNTLAVQLVFNGMKLQPCRPGFFEARDAIILADQQLTGGENFCTLWKGFAAKGLGPDANVVLRTPWGGGVRTDDFEMPLACGEAAEI